MENLSSIDQSILQVDSVTSTFELYMNNNRTGSQDDSDHEITNADILKMTRVIVQRILVPVIVTTGLTGNLVSIAVLTNRSMKSSTNIYLTFLAIFDSLYLITSFTLSFKHYPSIRNELVYKYWFPYGRVLSDMWANTSVILTVTFTVERYVAVCHPMKGRVICTPKRARIIAILMASFAIICTFPEFFEWKTVTITKDNTTSVKIIMTEFAQHQSYSVGFYYFIAIVFTFIPLVALVTFNSILIRSVCKANEIRKVMTNTGATRSDNRRQWEQHKTTLMLVGVAIVFIVCQLPSATLIIYNTYLEAAGVNLNGNEMNNLRIAGNIANILIQLNAAINFILYSAMSTKFRRVFLRIIHRIIPGKRNDYCYRDVTYCTGVSFSKSTNRQLIGYKGFPLLNKKVNKTVCRYQLSNVSSPYRSRDNLNESSDSIILKDTIIMKNGNVTVSSGTSL